jgi:hypothetical protein
MGRFWHPEDSAIVYHGPVLKIGAACPAVSWRRSRRANAKNLLMNRSPEQAISNQTHIDET